MEVELKNEEELLKKIIEKESWEEILYYIVSIENLDPWNLDLVKLAESFIKFLKRAKELDFRIPAKVVFIAVILLKLKVESLFEKEEEEKLENVVKQAESLEFDLSSINLEPPLKRLPKSQVTIDELIKALKKVLEFRERKFRREFFARRKVEKNIQIEDVEEKIQKIFKKIEEKTKQKEVISFKELVEEWKREKIVYYFVPILHLEANKKIKTWQKEFFKDIFIKKC